MMLINYRREKNYHFAVEKPGRHHLDQVRKLTLQVIKGTDIMYPQHDAPKGYNVTSVVLLPKMHTWHSTVRKPGKPKLQDGLHITSEDSSKDADHERQREAEELREYGSMAAKCNV